MMDRGQLATMQHEPMIEYGTMRLDYGVGRYKLLSSEGVTGIGLIPDPLARALGSGDDHVR